jgi:rubrerythrin
MTFLAWLREKVRGTLDEARAQDRHKLLTLLREAYHRQSENVANFTRHAEQMYYPHLREYLLRIVGEEQSHVRWLEEKISALGGHIPHSLPSPRRGVNTWENLRLDLEEEQRDEEAFLDGLRIAERFDHEIAEGLSRLRHDERKHREQLLDLLQKSEPDAVPTPPPQPEDVERQKQIWVAQQKMTWLEERRSLWEANGKPISWAEWIARREYEWTANELPNRELHWARRLAMQTATDVLVPRVSEKS